MNKSALDYGFILLGVCGAILALLSISILPNPLTNLVASTLLGITAIYFRLTFFVGVQLIILANVGSVIFNIDPVLQIAIPALLGIQLLIYYLLSKQLNIFFIFGIIGIIAICLGYFYTDPLYYLIGGLGIASVALHQVYCGQKIALLWVGLNIGFIILALLKLFQR